jgi:hypothetical protein
LDLVEGTQFDFGEVYAGAVVKRDLTLRNTGNDTLIISDVSSACGCTGTLISSNHIPPGGRGTLSITFNSRGMGGRAQKVVTFNTTDTSHGHVRVTFTADVIKSLALEPEYVVFKTNADSAVTAEVLIVNTGSTPVRILSAKSSSALVEVEMTRNNIGAGDQASMKCTLSPKSEGLINGTITIETDRPREPAINVRFWAQVGPRPRSHSN